MPAIECKDSLTELVKAAGLNGIELAAKIIGKAQLIIASIGKIGVDAAMASTLPSRAPKPSLLKKK